MLCKYIEVESSEKSIRQKYENQGFLLVAEMTVIMFLIKGFSLNRFKGKEYFTAVCAHITQRPNPAKLCTDII